MKTLNELYNDSLQSGLVDPKIFKLLVAKYLTDNKLFSYFNGLVFDESQPNIGCYNRESFILSLNLSLIKENIGIMDDYKTIIDETSLKSPGMELLYYYFLDILYHELTHIKQNKVIHRISFNNPLFSVLSASYRYATEDIYTDNHDLFPHEHSADVEGCISAVNFCLKHNKYVVVPEDSNVSTNLIRDYYIKDDKVISPSEQLFKDSLLDDLIYLTNNSAMSDYTKLLYGLPINMELFNQMNQIIDKKEKIKNLRGYKSC